jgi:biopolymer transport protein TolR
MNVHFFLFASAIGGEISGLIESSGLVAKAVLLILLVFSLASWAIIFSKWGLFRRARVQSNRFIRAFRKSERLQDVAAVAEQFKPSPLIAVFDGAYEELRKQAPHPIRMIALQRATQIAASEELSRLESRLPWLATTGAVTPFIGLFGTVWGIIDAFHGLGTGRPLRRHSRSDRLQHVHPAHSRVRRAHGRFQPGTDQRSRAGTDGRACGRKCGAAVMAFTNSRGRTQTSLADINVTPLVDVVLVLLIIFMITAPILQSGIEVAIPHTRTVKEITEERLVITIDRQQRVFLNNEPININQIGAQLQQKIRDPEGQSIFVRADENVPFGAFATVMDAVKQSGITNVSIVTQPLEKNGSRR